MKYFTIQWWAGEIEDQQEAVRAYDAYLESVKADFPADLQRIYQDVILHDSNPRRIVYDPTQHTLEIALQHGGRLDAQGKIDYSMNIQLTYSEVLLFESLADPDAGLPGPHGYGDLGYDEVEILRPGVFQHRILFSTGIELAVTFRGFALTCEKGETSDS